MAAWLDVYCARSVRCLTTADFLAMLDIADLFTEAEFYGIEDEVHICQARAKLQINPRHGTSDEWFEIRYRAPEFRPVLVYLSETDDKVRDLCVEAMERLDPYKKEHTLIQQHLQTVICQVSVELGWFQLEDMGVVLGVQIAQYVATTGNGLIRDYNDVWWAMSDNIPVLLSKKG